MHAASMNHVYRLVWSDRTQSWVPVAESRPARGKPGRTGRLAPIAAGLLALASTAALAGADLPTGGQIAQGQGSLSQSGSTLTIEQTSNRLVTNWASFNIASGQTVKFVQPSSTAVALNRVLGTEASSIQGQLLANGQVYLLNPNGVLFGAGARVDTAGLVASTLSMSDADFMAGRLHLVGDSAAGVRNDGSIVAREGGTVALIAAQVVNTGSIQADGGTVALASGQDVTLDLGGSVRLQVSQGTLDGLIANGGVIQADGGRILMTAQAADALSRSVINQTGVLRARTLSTGASGEIVLLGDMAVGEMTVGGTLDATAPAGGHGGQIETSAAFVETLAGLQVQAGAANGVGGTWLIDPYDYVINATAASNIVTALNGGTSVTVSTQSSNSSYGGGAAGSGDITVSSAIAKTGGGDATLTLRADRNIFVNSAISSTSGKLGITLSAANNASSNLGGVNVAANLTSNGGRILIGGAGGNQTSATNFGIGYALNTSATAAAVQIDTNVSILSAGGDITINGRSGATASGGSYSATRAGIYVLSGATVDSGGGNVFMSGISSADNNVFGFGVEANSNTITTFRSAATSGGIVVDAQNLQSINGALGLVNSGNQARVQFWTPNVAYMLFRLNGSNQATTFTVKSPCQTGAYPYCGTIVVPGTNGSYLYATYNVTTPETLPIYVFTGNGSKTYDGLTTASGLAVTTLGGPGGFTSANLGTLTFNTSSKNVGSYDSLSGDASNPGTYTSGGNTYAVGYFSQGTYTVTPKAISSFSAVDKVYDGTTAANVTGSGIVSGDAVTVNATGGFASANVGNGITVNVSGVSLSGADAGNYTFSGGGSISTTANITPATLTVAADNGSKTYDGLAYSGHTGMSVSGFVNGETSSLLTGTAVSGGSSQGAVNAGSYAISLSGLSAGSNYTISYVDGTLTVNPAVLTYTADAASRTYGASNPTLGGTVTGFVHGETLAGATTGTLAYTTTATTGSNVGSYAINGSGLSANHGNYVFTQASGNSTALTVTPASLTATATSGSKTYDGLAYSGGQGVSFSGFVNGDTGSVVTGSASYGGSSQGAVNAGSYAITPSGLSAGNYTISYVDGTLTVNPAVLTYTADVASRTYGASNPTLGGTVTGFVHGETLAGATTGTLAYTTTATTGSNVGSYAITGSGLSANHGNYVFTQASGNSAALTVTPATLTVTAANDSKVYDGSAYSGGQGVSVSGFVNGETSSLLTGTVTYGGSSQGAVNAGSYAITPSGLSAGGNYSLSYVDGTLSITPALLSIITGNLTGTVSKVYNGNTTATLQSSNYVLSGWLGSDGAIVTQTTGTYDNANAGAGKTVTVSLAASDFTATGSTNLNNYQLPTSVSGAVGTITPAVLTLTASGSSKTYDGGTASSGAPTVSGLQGSDTVTGLSQAYDNKNAGTGKTLSVDGYTVNDGNSGGNYSVTLVDNHAGVVTPATLTVVVTPASRFAGSANPAFSASVTGFVGTDTLDNATLGSLSFTTEAGAGAAAGSYSVVGSGLSARNGNYVLVQAAGNAQALTVKAAALPVADAYLPKASPVPNFPDNALPSLGAQQLALAGGNLNYVSIRSSAPDTGAPASGTDATARNRTARPGVAATAVPSANGPLDIFVIDGGLNVATDARP
jgi:filamentous hemagglutinin family protein